MKPKVLIVDDEQLNLMTFEAFLADDGYDLLFATGGKDAIALTRSQVPDVILLDVMMPEIDGFTVCRTLRADPVVSRVPIIIVTALHDSAARLEGLRAGADDFVTKPCSRDEIRARVRSIVSLNRFRTIAEQRVRFERLYELSPVGIVVTDEKAVVMAANPRAEEFLAVAGRPLPGDVLSERFQPATNDAIRSLVRDALNGQVPAQEIRCGAGDGARVLRIRSAVVPEDGARRVMLMLADATAEVRAREATEELNRNLDDLVRSRTRQLQEANALLMSYASFVSHDLRSPLTVMKGYLSMIHEGAVPLADSGPMIEAAYNAAVTMQELVQNILQLAQEEHEGTGTTVMTDPVPIVRRVWSHLGGLFPHARRQFRLTALPTVPASPVVIERVFYNLLANAIKFSADRPEPQVEVGCFDTPAGPAVFVRDNGIGFDARDTDKLFREFSRLPDAPATNGFGLGLSLVSRLIRAHGGEIWAEGERDRGATFFVRFAQRGAVEPATGQLKVGS